MKALLDANVILDVLLDRHPHVSDSARAFDRVITRQCEGFLGASTVTTSYYHTLA